MWVSSKVRKTRTSFANDLLRFLPCGIVSFYFCLRGKAVPVQAYYRPRGFKKVEASRLTRQSAHESVKGVSPIHWMPLPPQEIFLVLISVGGCVDQGQSASRWIMSMKNSIDTIGNQTHYLPACSVEPQPTAPPHAAIDINRIVNIPYVLNEVSIPYTRLSFTGRQCMYNITLMHIHETTVAVDKQLILHVLSVCLQP
jgi:hypothetical protein